MRFKVVERLYLKLNHEEIQCLPKVWTRSFFVPIKIKKNKNNKKSSF